MTLLIVLALLAILATLAAAGWFMLNPPPESGAAPTATGEAPAASTPAQRRRMARALAWRVALSVLLFVFILLAWALGWIEPKGIALR
jgi:hypothetical protein